MNLRRVALVLVASLLGGGCNWRSAEIRNRITVVMNTPQGVRSASAVWSFKLLPGGIAQSHSSRFRGEAIPVDLPNAKTVFVLLGERNLAEHALTRRFYPENNFPKAVDQNRYDQINYLKKHARTKIKLDCKGREKTFNQPALSRECPLLVAFRSLKNPSTVYELDPLNLSTFLGQGYSLVGIYLQVTDDRVTHQLKDRLPWLNALRGRTLDGMTASNHSTLANTLTFYDFKEDK